MTRPGLLMFCLRSLWREYGMLFIGRIVLRHPLRTLRGLRAYSGKQRGRVWGPGDQPHAHPRPEIAAEAGDAVIGLGFCLKPWDPQCPSGRANHDCDYFQRSRHLDPRAIPHACLDCRIRDIGLRALNAGCALYIMTSARDILFDLLLPAMEDQRFRRALLGLCRYSFEPFRIALSVVGLEAELVAFAEGDCTDYRSWRRADMGLKDERTSFSSEDLEAFFLGIPGATAAAGGSGFRKAGNIFVPDKKTSQALQD